MSIPDSFIDKFPAAVCVCLHMQAERIAECILHVGPQAPRATLLFLCLPTRVRVLSRRSCRPLGRVLRCSARFL